MNDGKHSNDGKDGNSGNVLEAGAVSALRTKPGSSRPASPDGVESSSDGSTGAWGSVLYSAKDRQLATLEQLLALDALDLDIALDRANTLLAETLDCEKSDTFLFDPSTNSLVTRGTSNTPLGIKQHQLGLNIMPLANGGTTAQVFLSGTPYFSGHVDQDPNELPGIKGALGIRSAISVVLDVAGERRGILQMDSVQPEKFTEADVHFIEAVSRWIGMVTHRAELVEKVTQEAAQQASRATAEELIEVLAHDMNNYLTPLGGWIGVLRRKAYKEQNQGYIVPADAAHRGLIRLRGLVKDLLDVRRLQYSLFTLLPEEVDLIELVNELTSSLQTSKLSILVQAPSDHALCVQADPARLRQALENLISNALKYSPPEVPVNITLDKETRRDGGLERGWAAITVRDEGPGIPKERMQSLFARYSAGPESTGLGLGLYLAKSIAEAHGGTLTVDSAPGKGTSFRLSLPM